MPSRKDSPNRNETFGRLLSGAINSIATYEGKTAPIVEEELGQLLNLSGKTIQRYKAGHLPPEHETVKVLAEAAVQRGFLDRQWLQRFLYVARYPFADKLLDLLKPIGPARVRPPRVYHNLPAPTYSQFVMRTQTFAEVIEGLQQRSAVVLISGLGGNGKTSLAREMAARCITDDSDAPQFDAVVWVSDKDRPGTTNLSVVLDEIARTLDYPGFAQFEHEEKRREVEQLLRRQRVLVVVDNFETITDGALLIWLLRMPEPSKALITSREYGREYRRGGWPVELRGMSESEAMEFVDQRLRVLRIEKLVSDPTQLEPLLLATGGNPKAIEIALGLVKHQHRSLQQVVVDLYAARGELFDDLFARAWLLLDEAEQRLLMVMSLFVGSASAEALGMIANVQNFVFDRSVAQLADLALLDIQQIDLSNPPSYTLHPLVHAFAEAKLSLHASVAINIRKRWVEWYFQLAQKVGFCWEDLSRLTILDPEYETLHAVIVWTSQNYWYQDVLNLIKEAGYYYYVRGLWDKQPPINLLAAEAAQKLNDYVEEVRARAHHVQLLSRQGNIAEAGRHFAQLETLATLKQLPEGVAEELPKDVFFEYQHASALYWIACNEIAKAQQILQQNLDLTQHHTTHIKYVFNFRRLLAWCLYRQGCLREAQQLFRAAHEEAIHHRLQRAIIANLMQLVVIDLDLGELASAQATLEECSLKAYEYQDHRRIVEIQRLYARLHTLRNDLPAARSALTEALDLFERLGMRREFEEARAELAQLNAPTAATT